MEVFRCSRQSPDALLDYTVIDLETTGLCPSKDGITEIAALKVRGGQVVDSFAELVNPERSIPRIVAEKTHITDEMVAGARPVREVLPRLFDFVGADIIVGYNIDRFDMGFICEKAMSELGLEVRAKTVDVWAVAKRKLPDHDCLRLGVLCEELGVDTCGAHRALKDCEMTHAVYQKLLEMPAVTRSRQVYFSAGELAAMQTDDEDWVRKYEEMVVVAQKLIATIPKDFKPVYKEYIPKDYKARWKFTATHPFKTFASSVLSITGSDDKVPRIAAEEIVCKLGATLKSTTTRDCDFCVALSNEAFGKLEAAKKWQGKGSPIRIIGPDEFLSLMNNSIAEKPMNVEDVAAFEREIAETAEREIREAKEAVAAEKAAKAAAKEKRRQAADAAKKAREEAELAAFDGPRMKISLRRFAMWREEFTELWNRILADDIIEKDELALLRDWLNRHKTRRDDYVEMLKAIDELDVVGSVDANEAQRLYGLAEGVLASLTPEGSCSGTTTIEFKTAAVRELAAVYLPASNPAHPFLDPTYPESVMMPVADFTDIVSDWHEKGDVAELRELWKFLCGGQTDSLEHALAAATPDGLTISDYAKKELWAIYALTLRMATGQGRRQAVEAGGRMLATTLSTRDFSLALELENALIYDMGKTLGDKAGQQFAAALSAVHEGVAGFSDFAGRVKTLPPSLRVVLADIARDAANEDGVAIVHFGLNYVERCYGCSARMNRELVDTLGILEIAIPPVDAVPKSLNRRTLQDALKSLGVEYNREEKRETYISQMMEHPAEWSALIAKHAPDMKRIRSEFALEAQAWSARTAKLEPLARSLLRYIGL